MSLVNRKIHAVELTRQAQQMKMSRVVGELSDAVGMAAVHIPNIEIGVDKNVGKPQERHGRKI